GQWWFSDAGLGHRDGGGGGAGGEEAASGGAPSGPAAVAGVGQRGDHGLRDTARATGLVDDKDLSGRVSLPQQVIGGQWGQPPQIPNTGSDAGLGQPPGPPQRHRNPVAEGHEREV